MKPVGQPERTISQRALRNDNAAIIDAVEEGETFTVTRAGRPVATLGPYRPSGPPLLRAASKPSWQIKPLNLKSDETTEELIDFLRGER